jgi:hypothetical protein
MASATAAGPWQHSTLLLLPLLLLLPMQSTIVQSLHASPLLLLLLPEHAQLPEHAFHNAFSMLAAPQPSSLL